MKLLYTKIDGWHCDQGEKEGEKKRMEERVAEKEGENQNENIICTFTELMIWERESGKPLSIPHIACLAKSFSSCPI